MLFFSKIYSEFYYKFNKWTSLWMWKKEVLFSVLYEYLRIIRYEVVASTIDQQFFS